MKDKTVFYVLIFLIVIIIFAGSYYLIFFQQKIIQENTQELDITETEMELETDNENFLKPLRNDLYLFSATITSIDTNKIPIEIIASINLKENFENGAGILTRTLLIKEGADIFTGKNGVNQPQTLVDVSVLEEGDMIIALAEESVVEILSRKTFSVSKLKKIIDL